MKIIQASFFWQNDKPGGLGFTLVFPTFTPDELASMFTGRTLTEYLAASDRQLGTYNLYLSQLEALGERKVAGEELSMPEVILASYNIIWLVERGFIPNDEFNGYQFVKAELL